MIENFNAHAANERTFLAWVRTAMAIVGFGLAAARLGDRPVNTGSEIALFVAGGVVILLSYFRMRILKRRIDAESVYDDDVETGDFILVLLIASLFVLTAVFVLHIS